MTNELSLISISIFTIISLVSILLHDFKYLFFLNGHSKLKAVIICGIYTVFNTVVTKRIAEVDLVVSCTVITITNMISMWIAMIYNEKQLKEYIFKFEISIKSDYICEEIKKKFKEQNIPWKQYWFYYENNKENEPGDTKYNELQVYCFTKEHTSRVKNILKNYDYKDVKYTTINTSNYIER